MIKVFQTEFGGTGNCMSACLASLFELDIEKVPNFFARGLSGNDEGYWRNLNAWLKRRGYGTLPVRVTKEQLEAPIVAGFCIVSGPSVRDGTVYHATIWNDGMME